MMFFLLQRIRREREVKSCKGWKKMFQPLIDMAGKVIHNNVEMSVD